MSHLTALEFKNIQKFKFGRLDGLSDRPVTQVLGENGAGKSTILNLIFWLFYTRSLPTEIVKHGEKSGYIMGEFEITDDELVEFDLDGGTYIVRKNFAPSGPTLKVYPKDASTKPIASPQDFINRVLAVIGFNPLEFCDAPSDKQKDMLLELVGLKDKLRELDASYDATYKEREGVNRDAKQLKTMLDKTPVVQPITKRDFMDIVEKRDKAAAKNAENEEKRRRLAAYKTEQEELRLDGARLKADKEDLTAQIEALQKRLASVERKLVEKRDAYSDLNMKIAVLEPVVEKLVDYDLAQFNEEIQHIEEINVQAAHYEQRRRLQAEYDAKKATSDELTATLRATEAKKGTMLKEANYPLDGLEYSEEGVRYNGTLIESLSRAEKLLVGLSVMSALNPKLRLAIIDDGERLVGKNREAVKDWAEKNNINVMLAIASASDTLEDGIVIEDGEIVRETHEVKP